MLRLQRGEGEVGRAVEQGQRRGAEGDQIVVHQHRRLTQQVAVLAADGAPDQRAVTAVELLDPHGGLDHLGPGQAEPSLLAHDDGVAQAGDDAHAAEAAELAAVEHDHGNTGGADRQHGAHHLGHGDQAGVGLVQAHAAELDQQQDGGRALVERALQQAGQLGAVHLAHRRRP